MRKAWIGAIGVAARTRRRYHGRMPGQAPDLEAARARYDVRWILADSFRLDKVPGFRVWRDAHFHAVQNLGGGAVIYEANLPP